MILIVSNGIIEGISNDTMIMAIFVMMTVTILMAVVVEVAVIRWC